MIDAQQLQDTIYAAKAAGLPPIVYSEGIGTGYWTERGDFVCWNPREDSGRALELAVAAGLSVNTNERDWCSPCTTVTWAAPGRWPEERHGADPIAATRTAIFRAAVAIGKATP